MLLQKRFQLAVDANRDLPKSLPGCPFSCCMIICGQTATVFSLSFLLYSWLISNGFRDFQIENIKVMIFNAILHENWFSQQQIFMLWSKEERSGGTVDWPQNSRLLTWLGFLGYQQAAGYVKTQCLSYAVKILPTYPVPTLGFLHFVLPCIEAFGLKCNTTIKSIFDTKSRYFITQWKLMADK